MAPIRASEKGTAVHATHSYQTSLVAPDAKNKNGSSRASERRFFPRNLSSFCLNLIFCFGRKLH
jgi:hypothetical protein